MISTNECMGVFPAAPLPDFKRICDEYELGNIKGKPAEISHQNLHRTFKIETEHGNYALKEMNPLVMQEENAAYSYIFSETVARILRKNNVPVRTAIVHNEMPLLKEDNQYYMVFDWIDGSTKDANQINIDSCRKIGAVLAQIHQTEFKGISVSSGKKICLNMDWGECIVNAKIQKLEWADTLSAHIDRLYKWEQNVKRAEDTVLRIRVLSHRDLDPKNVIWDTQNNPIIIDWESAGNTNPIHELLETAVYWAGIESECFRKERFMAVVESYFENGGKMCGNFRDAWDYGFKAPLERLQYDVQCCLGLTPDEPQRRETWDNGIVKTMQAMLRYEELMPECLEWLEQVKTR